MFNYIENVFDQSILDDIILKYCKEFRNDLSSHDLWKAEITHNKSLPAVRMTPLTNDDRLKIINWLYTHTQSPFYKNNKIKQCIIAVQKLSPGGCIPLHTDTYFGSFTIFLNKEPLEGGNFVWFNDSKEVFSYSPKFNCGVYSYFDNTVAGSMHGVSKLTDTNTRYTLQIFLHDGKEDAN